MTTKAVHGRIELEPDGTRRIRTVRGVGYVFDLTD